MSESVLVCWKDGLPVHSVGAHGYRHSMGGGSGAIPQHRRHYPVPVLRTDYDRAYSPDVTPEEFRAIRDRALARERDLAAEREARTARPPRPLERPARLSVLGEGLHAAFRKGIDGPQAMPIWRLIRDMDPAEWGQLVEWLDWALGEAGYRRTEAP